MAPNPTYMGLGAFLRRSIVTPTTRVAVPRLEDEKLHADLVRWGWRPHLAKDRAAPINALVEKVTRGPIYRTAWPNRAKPARLSLNL